MKVATPDKELRASSTASNGHGKTRFLHQASSGPFPARSPRNLNRSPQTPVHLPASSTAITTGAATAPTNHSRSQDIAAPATDATALCRPAARPFYGITGMPRNLPSYLARATRAEMDRHGARRISRGSELAAGGYLRAEPFRLVKFSSAHIGEASSGTSLLRDLVTAYRLDHVSRPVLVPCWEILAPQIPRQVVAQAYSVIAEVISWPAPPRGAKELASALYAYSGGTERGPVPFRGDGP